jgi:hypothetical protein
MNKLTEEIIKRGIITIRKYIYSGTVYLSTLNRIEVLMAASMKMAVFWVVALCSLVEVYQCFRGSEYL